MKKIFWMMPMTIVPAATLAVACQQNENTEKKSDNTDKVTENQNTNEQPTNKDKESDNSYTKPEFGERFISNQNTSTIINSVPAAIIYDIFQKHGFENALKIASSNGQEVKVTLNLNSENFDLPFSIPNSINLGTFSKNQSSNTFKIKDNEELYLQNLSNDWVRVDLNSQPNQLVSYLVNQDSLSFKYKLKDKKSQEEMTYTYKFNFGPNTGNLNPKAVEIVNEILKDQVSQNKYWQKFSNYLSEIKEFLNYLPSKVSDSLAKIINLESLFSLDILKLKLPENIKNIKNEDLVRYYNQLNEIAQKAKKILETIFDKLGIDKDKKTTMSNFDKTNKKFDKNIRDLIDKLQTTKKLDQAKAKKIALFLESLNSSIQEAANNSNENSTLYDLGNHINTPKIIQSTLKWMKEYYTLTAFEKIMSKLNPIFTAFKLLI